MQRLPWPAYSPDMSPIEHVWDLVGRSCARDLRPAALKDELLLRIQAKWNSLPQADIQNLFDFMLRRIEKHCSAWWLFALKISSFICTNTNRFCIKFHLILMIRS
ncbi:transposable element Tcb2 transposase [Trichonephila clavipes]|nr:transposable element Tcb2 transposase [Trichonephila clavipes]